MFLDVQPPKSNFASFGGKAAQMAFEDEEPEGGLEGESIQARIDKAETSKI